MRFGSAADTTSVASSSAPSASVTPVDAPVLRADRDDFGAGAHVDPRAFAAARARPREGAGAAAGEHGRAGRPPSVPAESFRNTAAVPAAHGPIAVEHAAARAAADGLVLEDLLHEVGDGHRQRADRLAPGLAAQVAEGLPELEPHDRVGDRRRLRVGRRGDVHVGEEARDRTHLAGRPANASASWVLRSRSSLAVRAGSPQNVTAEPSGCGANIRTSGAIARSHGVELEVLARPTRAGGPPCGRFRAP